MLAVDTLNTLLFSTQNGNQLLYQLNAQLKSLIDNDRSFLEENSATPTIWECKWLNDYTIDGYGKGAAVWINAQSPYTMLNTRYDQIVQYVMNNNRLKAMYMRIDQNDQSKINDFLLKAIEGKASSSVSALYYLGDISKSIQIKVSTIDNNKTMPTDDSPYWYDFYRKSDLSSNELSMLECLSSTLSSSLSSHVDRYHISSLSEPEMSAMGFFKRKPFNVDDVQTQNFYDHKYCEHMEGFDYVVNWIYQDTRWCRMWKSGYLEQGGYIQNVGAQLLNVQFLSSYNYPIGQKFYQDGYDQLSIGEQSTYVACIMASNNRYCFTVTPILKKEANIAYKNSPNVVDDSNSYSSVDVTNMTNSSFSIVNLDTQCELYSKYYFYVAGYIVPKN